MQHYKTLDFGETCDKHTAPFVRLWMLRILVRLGAINEFVQRYDFRDDNIAEFLGLSHYLDEDVDFKPRAIKREIASIAKQQENEPPKGLLPVDLQKNLKRLGGLIDLNSVEQCLLGFSILIKTEPLLENCADYLSSNLTASKTYRALAIILNIPEKDIKMVLGANSNLVRSGILKLSEHTTSLDRKLELFSSGFADAILAGETEPTELFKKTVAKSSAPTLTLSDYQHVKQLSVVLPLLRQAVNQGLKGINVFIYGPPGTGKTQLAKVLAQEFQTDLFEVACEDEDGDPISGERRLRALSAAHSFLAQRQALMVFDEAEDVFNNESRGRFGGFGGQSIAQRSKAWVNRALEENPTPTIWLSNTCDDLDPAFIRRYSMVFELPVPPESQRKKVINQYTGNFVSDHVAKQLAKADCLAPAVVANAAKVTEIISKQTNNVNADEVFSGLINQTLEAQDFPAVHVRYQAQNEQAYSTNYLNTNMDIATVIDGLKTSRQGRLCFYGPPGTGKTALGKHIAEVLDLPIICKKVSDLVSCYVGETEKNIAQAFKRASEDGAVLLIDEVDSFLQERANAKHSWEQTQVNEMLTQIESFEGIFIASTNLIDTLDAASIRRFDAKIKFDYLNQNQLADMVVDFCQRFSIAIEANALSSQIKHLHAITPGDFALIGRQSHFNPVSSLVDLITRLDEEQTLKGEAKNKMGFI